mmetsp:Transcript_19779/g.24393  ORF Transcript_19779/g.24393 Transcript_19779/m.24393 type:complete len:306 (-) Transcript_19779:58-975(-)
MSMFKVSLVVSLAVITAYRGNPKLDGSSGTLVADKTEGSEVSQSPGEGKEAEGENPVSKVLQEIGHEEDVIINKTAEDVEWIVSGSDGRVALTWKPMISKQTFLLLRVVIPSGTIVVFGLLAAIVNRFTKQAPQIQSPTAGSETLDLKDWSSGHWDCCSEPAICCNALCCCCVRWADTMDMAHINSFWPALFVFLLFAVLTCWCPYFWIGNIVLFIHGRQALREGFGMKQQGNFSSLFGDCLFVSFCNPCALTQEARHVEKAIEVNHPFVQGNQPLPSQATAAAPAAVPTAPVPETAPRQEAIHP